MRKRILLIQGHPDISQDHLCHALASAYASGAAGAGHEIRQTTVALLDFPLLRSQQEWEQGAVPPALVQAQVDIQWCQHMVMFSPLWLGDMPALFKGFLEQVARPGFAFASERLDIRGPRPLKGRSAHVVITMGMPAMIYRWYFWEHGHRSLKRSVLRFVGIAPVGHTLIGITNNTDATTIAGWIKKLEELGRDAN